MKNFSAFTLRKNHRLRVLRTQVTVSADTKINPNSHKKIYNAIWDTGASGTVVSNDVAKEMNLTPVGKTIVSTANGMTEVYKYIVTLELPNKMIIKDIEVVSGTMGKDIDLLIGMDIISLGDFSITNVDNQTIFTFRYPSCETIDYVSNAMKFRKRDALKLKKQIEEEIRKNGNKLCPCGSRKKYRYCCGKEAIKKAKQECEKLGV